MKKLTILLLMFYVLPVYAGAEIESFRVDIKNYLSEQAKTPNKIIQYTDSNGYLVRLILAPKRVNTLLLEVQSDISQIDSFKAIMNEFKPVMANYQQAFKDMHGEYDAEYLDSVDFSFRLLMASVKQLNALNTAEIKDENMLTMMDGVQKMMVSLPLIFLSALEEQVNKKAFSESFMPAVAARLVTFRALLNDAKLPQAK